MTEPKLRADARRNRAAVLEAAAEVLAEAGTDVAIERIAERAGVGIGTVYRHFPSKEALFQAVMTDRLVRMAENIEHGLGAGEGGIAELMRDFAGEVGLKRMLLDRLRQDDGGFDIRGTPEMRRLLDAMDAVVATAQKQGNLRADVTVNDLFAVTVAAAQSPAGDRLIELAMTGMQPPQNLPGH